MTYEQALAFLESRLNFERRDMPARQDLRTGRIALLLEELGSPHLTYPVVHVAGTKGKGSTASMIAALLGRAGYKVGLHTSPHFSDVEERLRIDGRPASQMVFTELVEELFHYVERVDARLGPDQTDLTYFEITTALALLYFAREAVDWAVVEVGMGGRLDSTNVVSPAVSVITSISKDHTQILGERIQSIAGEKAGIIKPGRPVVSGVTQSPARDVIRRAADRTGSRYLELGTDFSYRYASRGIDGTTTEVRTWYRRWPRLELALHGEHQARNCAVALAVLDVLSESGPILDPCEISTGLATLRLPGRFEILGLDPMVVLDVAHNEASARALAETLRTTFGWQTNDFGKRVLIFGVSRDKDWRAMLWAIAPWFDHIVLTTFRNNPRALPAERLASDLGEDSLPVSVTSNPMEAWLRALDLVESSGIAPEYFRSNPQSPNRPVSALICVAGSFYLVAELRELLSETIPAIR